MTTVGLDLGGTKIVGAAVDGTEVRRAHKVPTPTDGVNAVVHALVDTAVEVAGGRPDAVGIGTPGVVEPGTGRVLRAPNVPGFEEPVELGHLVARALGAPVYVGNDVNVAAYAEAKVGAASGHDDVLAVWLGTGLGAGLVLGGELRVGPHGLAGELGHTVVRPGGRRCPCGGAGHLEAYVGRRALEQRVRELHAAGRRSVLVDNAGEKPIKSKAWYKAIEAGDEVATELIDEAVEMLGFAVTNVALLVDIDAVVIGGGLGERIGPIVEEGLRRAFRELLFVGRAPTILHAALGDHAGTIGAALLAAQR